MAITRECGACGKTISRTTFIELQVRVMRTHGEQYQDAIEQSYEDYCDNCIKSGAALSDVIKALKYTVKG